MGWFSDSLFGKRKRMDPNKMNSFMAPYNRMLDEQEDIARQMMDPQSRMNVQQRAMMRSQQMDMVGAQNRGLMSAAAMSNVSPGQAAMQSSANMSQARGTFGNQYRGMLGSQNQMGLGLLGGVMSGRQGEGQRQSNMYMQQINAHNAARQANVGMVVGLAGAAIGAAGSAAGGGGGPTSDIALKENIELVGKSLKGVNIYEFDYKDKFYGKGRYRGVMAQEVPNASHKGYDGYLRVNYNKLDVNFERIA